MFQHALQFGGSPSEDPNTHIDEFMKLYDIYK